MKSWMNIRYFGGEGGEAPLTYTAEADNTAAIEVGSPTTDAETSGITQPAFARETGEGSEHEPFGYKQFKEQFKEQYQADLQRVIDKRFKNAKKVEAQRDALLEQNEQYGALMNALAERYGTDDPELLIGKIGSFESDLEQLAQRENMSVEDFKRLHSARKEAASYKAELESVKAQLQQQAIVEKWQQDAAALAEIYPDFRLEDEIDNERFSTALQNGMEMRDAYQYAHFDEILSGAIEHAAQNVKNAVEQSRAQRAARPLENGIQSGSAAIVKQDVSRLSKSDMEEIDRLVLRGEKISF